MLNRQEKKEFEVKKGLDSLVCNKNKRVVTVNEPVVVILKNGQNVSGVLANVGPSSITLRVSGYEYTNTGIEYTQKLILIKDIDEFMDGFEDDADKIDWKLYSEALW